jgi:hypothetical protein
VHLCEIQRANAARFTFLDPAATEFYPGWDAVAAYLALRRRHRRLPRLTSEITLVESW